MSQKHNSVLTFTKASLGKKTRRPRTSFFSGIVNIMDFESHGVMYIAVNGQENEATSTRHYHYRLKTDEVYREEFCVTKFSDMVRCHNKYIFAFFLHFEESDEQFWPSYTKICFGTKGIFRYTCLKAGITKILVKNFTTCSKPEGSDRNRDTEKLQK